MSFLFVSGYRHIGRGKKICFIFSDYNKCKTSSIINNTADFVIRYTVTVPNFVISVFLKERY